MEQGKPREGTLHGKASYTGRQDGEDETELSGVEEMDSRAGPAPQELSTS